MENFGLEVAQGSEIVNLTIPTGTAFPANDNVGELFYRTDEDTLYVRNNTGWAVSGGSATVGSISSIGSTSTPDGYLQCDGSTVSRTTYVDLFTEIGTIYGVGDGSTTFDIPDLRGEFLRGWDDARGVDTGRALGSTQTDLFKAHTHPSSALNIHSAHTVMSGGIGVANDGNSTGSTGGTETRPRNVAVMYVIKY